MRFRCQVRRVSEDRWSVRYEGTDVGPVEVAAPDREQALEKMRQELQYRLELCPCTGETYRHIQIEIVQP
jgi:hypothetical protein